ncbi:hypothetical protein [Sphingomonas sp. Leaf67]|uniref:hypothetical protein n=1 Tax=Sphingomonas sp. Leaf67 TaxID=1736230 RepID=UPI0012E14FC3|nr:hypothetical protein [Sphingomonas sp. Leaf67]
MRHSVAPRDVTTTSVGWTKDACCRPLPKFVQRKKIGMTALTIFRSGRAIGGYAENGYIIAEITFPR